MELFETLLKKLSDVWITVGYEPLAFSVLAIAIFLLGFGIALWYYWREVRILRALHGVQEQRIKSHQQEKGRLAALLEPKTAETFSAIHRAPSHRMDVPYSPAQITARPEYRLLLELGMITIEQIAPNQTSLSSTSAATKLWEAVKRN
jgi:hypothetical protein